MSTINYDPATGIFTRRDSPHPRYDGPCGTLRPTGDVVVWYQGKLVLAHRLAWYLTHGHWPDGILDHIDGDPSNNRLANLRLATRAQNMQNSRPRIDKAVGLKGVSYRVSRGKFKWTARIKHAGKIRRLGSFDTVRQAHIAYCLEALECFGEFARFA